MRFQRLVALTFLVSLQVGCVITERAYERDGKRYGVIEGAFRGRWYNHYERGRSFADGGYCDEAVADFDAAIQLRASDQRRARTYGLHFIDYFPNRERGICLLKQGAIAPAIEALTVSLSHIDSGRAEFYLNEARREQLVESGVVDTEPPSIEGALTSRVVRGAVFTLDVHISDASNVMAVSVNGVPVLLPTAVDSYRLQAEVALEPGTNDIEIKAWDLFRNRVARTLQLTVDDQPPAVSLADVVEERGRQVLVGSVEDAGGLSSVTVNGAKQIIQGDRPLEIRTPITGDTVTLHAEDRVGNATDLSIEVAELRERAAADDRAPPTVTIQPLPATVYSDRVFVDGWVSDAGSVDVLEIAGEAVPGVGGRTVYFRRVVRLQNGLNEIPVLAIDDHGAKSESELTVTREVPAARAIENRLSIAMAPFIAAGETDEGRDAVEQNLEAALVGQRRFFVFDRTRVQALVTEWQLVVSDLTRDAPELLELGGALETDTTLMGWVAENQDSIEVYGRLVDTQTGVILLEKDVFHEKKSLRNIRDLLFGLALKFEAALPLLQGTLKSTDDDLLEIAMKNAALLPTGAHVLLIDPSGPQEQVLGQARVEEIGDDVLRARMVRGTPAAELMVLTK
jgi:TolB-like protein